MPAPAPSPTKPSITVTTRRQKNKLWETTTEPVAQLTNTKTVIPPNIKNRNIRICLLFCTALNRHWIVLSGVRIKLPTWSISSLMLIEASLNLIVTTRWRINSVSMEIFLDFVHLAWHFSCYWLDCLTSSFAVVLTEGVWVTEIGLLFMRMVDIVQLADNFLFIISIFILLYIIYKKIKKAFAFIVFLSLFDDWRCCRAGNCGFCLLLGWGVRWGGCFFSWSLTLVAPLYFLSFFSFQSREARYCRRSAWTVTGRSGFGWGDVSRRFRWGYFCCGRRFSSSTGELMIPAN